MKLEPIAPRPLAGPPLQFALLLPFFVLFLLIPPRFPRCCMGIRYVAFPDTPTPHRLSSTEGDIVISVQADGMAFIGTKWFPPAELATRLNQLAISTSNPNVLLRLDRSLSYRSVRRLLRILAEAGFSRISFVTSEGYAGEELPFTALPGGAA